MFLKSGGEGEGGWWMEHVPLGENMKYIHLVSLSQIKPWQCGKECVCFWLDVPNVYLNRLTIGCWPSTFNVLSTTKLTVFVL